MLKRGSLEKRITEILIQHGKIKPTTLEEIVVDNFTSIDDNLMGEMLVSLGLITYDDFSQAIAEQKKLGFVDLSKVSIDTEFQKSCPLDLVEAHLIYPLYQNEKNAVFALHSPPEHFVFQLLRTLFKKEIVFLVANKLVLYEEIQKFIGTSIRNKMEKQDSLEGEKWAALIPPIDGVSSTTTPPEEVHPEDIIEFVDDLFYKAIISRASDIHLESNRTGILVRFRIDGVLNNIIEVRGEYRSAVFSRVMILSGMDITLKNIPQDGRLDGIFGEGKLRMEGRAALIPGVWGPNINIRILKNIRIEYNLEVLGFTEKNLKIVRSHLKRKFGLILIGGPTGSGKSTTIYSCIEAVKSQENQVITIEDPVEVPLDGIIQMGVVSNRHDDDRSVSFGKGLRAILRMDPDVIVIGEIRDEETASIAISSSLTGHLVISTVHAKNTLESLRRLMDLGVPGADLFAAINLIISQRLVRMICDLCKVVIELPIENQLLSLKYQESSKIYAGRGCSRCLGTGYYDRTGIFELLPIEEEIQAMGLKSQSDLAMLKTIFKEKGYSTLNDDACLKVMHGITSLDEVTRILWEI